MPVGFQQGAIMVKPSLFIGSSSEGVEFARAVRTLLDRDVEASLWNEGFFKLGSTFIETLVNSIARFDFAVLLLTPDDLVSSRDKESFGPRDNVIFELGLFMGRLGRSRTFVVHEAEPKLKIPTDLSGVNTATYHWPRDDNNHIAAVGPAADSIRLVIRELGVSESKTSKQIQEVRQNQDRLQGEVDALRFLVTGFVNEYEIVHLKKLADGGIFDYERGMNKDDSFIKEIIRLRDFGLIEKHITTSIWDIPPRGNLKDYVRITQRGRDYLKLRKQINEPG
jgi:hypothetical protein